MGKQQQMKIELDNRSHINAFKNEYNVATKIQNYSYIIGCRCITNLILLTRISYEAKCAEYIL